MIIFAPQFCFLEGNVNITERVAAGEFKKEVLNNN